MRAAPWPKRPSLDDAFDKLARAKEHFEAVRREIEPFEKRDTHTINFEADPDARKFRFYINDLESLPNPTGWGLMVGDCLHNARTALDYLMVRLVTLATQENPRDISSIQFPIYREPKKFASAVGGLRKHPELSGYLARIEELQPFNRGNPSVWGEVDISAKALITWVPVQHPLPAALNRLSILDNIDKHPIIHTAWLSVQFDRDRPGEPPMEEVLKVPRGFIVHGGGINLGPLEDGEEVGSIEFRDAFPADWEPDQVDMKRQFAPRVSLQDEMNRPASVLDVLLSCIWGVEAVLTIFRPVFADILPPLPVTAIPDPKPPHLRARPAIPPIPIPTD